MRKANTFGGFLVFARYLPILTLNANVSIEGIFTQGRGGEERQKQGEVTNQQKLFVYPEVNLDSV